MSRQGYDPDNGERCEHGHPRPPGRLRQRPGGRADRAGRRRPDGSRSDGNRRDVKVAGNSRQLGIGPRRKRPVHPEVERLFRQPFVGERRLEYVDGLLAISVRCAKVPAVGSPFRHLVSRPCHHAPPQPK